MIETDIQVQIHALMLTGAIENPPHYRLYVNDDLITEREWIWDIDHIINESFVVNIPFREQHQLRIETFDFSTPFGFCRSQLAFKHLKINNKTVVGTDQYRPVLSFLLEDKYNK